jgi:pimeloyl-ACP methyl ester carboxylesterase
MKKLPLLVTVVAVLCLAVPAQAAEPYRAVNAAPGAGPAKYDKVFVQRFGSPKAKRVLVLVPGFVGGAGDFRLIARDIVKRVPGLQVWAFDRRTQAFEDTSGFAGGDPAKAQDYYLGFKYKRVVGKDVPFVGKWGLKQSLEDLRRVVRRARAGGRRKVILGGHSLGASTTVAYAAWDFNGRPGYKDLTGMVLIDGGLLGTFDSASAKRARTVLKQIREGGVFADLLGLGIPEAAGFFSEVAALYARKLPNARSVLQDSPLIPARFKPEVPATNEGVLGFAFDADTSPKGLELIRINAGSLNTAVDPARWVNGELTPIQRFAEAFSGESPNATEWYFPRRLTLDVDAASSLRSTAATRLLGLRARHAAKIDIPLYAFETDLTNGRVIRGARRLRKRARGIKTYTFVKDTKQSHIDPLVAAPRRNNFLKTVVPFLKKKQLR